MGNAIYGDLIQALIMVLVDHLVLAVSNSCSGSGVQRGRIQNSSRPSSLGRAAERLRSSLRRVRVATTHFTESHDTITVTQNPRPVVTAVKEETLTTKRQIAAAKLQRK